MTPKRLVMLSAALVLATGVVLMAAPEFVVRVLLGGGFSGDVKMARFAGFAPFVLGLVCWPGQDDVTTQTIWSLFTYDLLSALYLGYFLFTAGPVRLLLGPACAIHALLAFLLAGPVNRDRFRTQIARSGP
jgi:hypothetical protein